MSLLTAVVPETLLGDRIIATYRFLKKHARPPSGRMLINDYLYRLKISGELADPLRKQTTDKLLVKDYISRKVGEGFVIPTLHIMTSTAEVQNFKFEVGQVVKPSHASGVVKILGSQQDVDTVKKREVVDWLLLNYYRESREQNYIGLEPRILVEAIVFGDEDAHDYKIFCFRGVPRLIQLDMARFRGHRRGFFDTSGQEMPFSLEYPRLNEGIRLPSNFPELLEIARALSQDFEFVRVDLYTNGRDIKVGELTHCPGSAGERFSPQTAELLASRLIFGDV